MIFILIVLAIFLSFVVYHYLYEKLHLVWYVSGIISLAFLITSMMFLWSGYPRIQFLGKWTYSEHLDEKYFDSLADRYDELHVRRYLSGIKPHEEIINLRFKMGNPFIKDAGLMSMEIIHIYDSNETERMVREFSWDSYNFGYGTNSRNPSIESKFISGYYINKKGKKTLYSQEGEVIEGFKCEWGTGYSMGATGETFSDVEIKQNHLFLRNQDARRGHNPQTLERERDSKLYNFRKEE